MLEPKVSRGATFLRQSTIIYPATLGSRIFLKSASFRLQFSLKPAMLILAELE
jgi:hypothetical protein